MAKSPERPALVWKTTVILTGRAESGDPIREGLPGTGTKWVPGNGHWLQGRQRFNPSQRDLPLTPPPPRPHPASRLRVLAASAPSAVASPQPASTWGEARRSRRSSHTLWRGSCFREFESRGCGGHVTAGGGEALQLAAASGGGAWNLGEKGVRDVAGLRVEGWGWRGEVGPQAGRRLPDPQRFLGLCQRFSEVSDFNSRFLCEELICVYLLWSWSKLECWER